LEDLCDVVHEADAECECGDDTFENPPALDELARGGEHTEMGDDVGEEDALAFERQTDPLHSACFFSWRFC